MTPLLERLFELLAQWWARLVPWFVLGDDQVGLVRRLGVTHHLLHHGLNWKWPIIDEAMPAISALDSTVLREQSLTTLDGVQVTLRCVLTYRVVDAKRWLIDVNDPESVLNDAGCLAVSELVPELGAFEVLQGTEFTSKLTRRVRARAKKWGIEVEAVGLNDRTAAPTYRIMGVK
jgi:regulator of protease activity HflC (stomatin/prohibitin superfamily)